jgi:O-antigen ligase/Flp pilus assembly protein TadD
LTAEYSLAVLVGLLPVLVNPVVPDSFTQPKATLTGVVAVLLLAAWLVEGLVAGRFRLARTPVDRFVVAFYALLVASTLFSKNFGLSIFGPYKWREGLVYLACYGVIFYGAATYLTGKALKRALTWGAAGAAIVAIYAIAQRAGLDVTQWFGAMDPTRAFSTLGNPVYLGAYATLVAPVAAGYALASREGSRERFLAGAVAVLGVIAAAVSYSRAAWLGLAIGFVVLALLSPRRKQVALWAAGLVAVLVIAAAVPVAGQSQDFATRLGSTFTFTQADSARVALWRGAVTLAARNPLLGVGPEAFKQEFAQIKPTEWSLLDPEDKSARAHSDVLHVAATAGIPAALAYIAILALLIGRGVWTLARPEGRAAAFGASDGAEGRRSLVAGLLASVVAYVVFLQFGFTMIDVTPVFWALAGALVAQTKGLGQAVRLRDWAAPKQVMASGFHAATLAVVGLAAAALVWVFVTQSVADYYFGRALKAESGGMLATGVSDIERALALSPREDYYWFFLGKSYVIVAQTRNDARILSMAEQAYEKALSLNRADSTLLNSLGSAYYIGATRFGRTEDLTRSEYYYKRTLLYDKNDPDALHRLGQISFQQEKYGLAASYFEQAVKASADRPAFHYNLALAYAELGQLAKAEASVRKAIKLDSEDQQAKDLLSDIQRERREAAKKGR